MVETAARWSGSSAWRAPSSAPYNATRTTPPSLIGTDALRLNPILRAIDHAAMCIDAPFPYWPKNVGRPIPFRNTKEIPSTSYCRGYSMARGQVARASVAIGAPISKVWNALVNPDAIKRYMFGASVVSDWREGSSIVWKGEWQGRPYQDKGVIVRFQPDRTVQYTHFSPLSGVPDTPENYHTVTLV